MELIAVLPGAVLPSPAEWQMALAKLGLPFLFDTLSSPAAAKGFCSMRAGKIMSGVEIFDDTGSAPPGCPLPDGPHRIVAFRWSSDMLEHACALSAAAALAEAGCAIIYDPADGMGRLDPHRLTAMAAETAAAALRENGKALSVQKVVRAIGRMPEMDWRFVVGGRVVCRSIEGPYMRGIHVDRTSSSGVYSLRVMQTLWCFVEDTVYLTSSIELRWFRGGLDRIVDSLRQELASDEVVRRCIMADPGQPFLPDRRFGWWPEGVERALMQALDGDGAGALPLLRRVVERCPTLTHPKSDHRWKIVPKVIACIEQGADVGAVLYPLAEEAKARISVKPIRSRDTVQA